MDDYDRHWHDEAATGLRIGVWVAIIAGAAAGMALGTIALAALPSIAATMADPLAGIPY